MVEMEWDLQGEMRNLISRKPIYFHLLFGSAGLQSPGLTKHSSVESSLSEKLHHEEDEHKASVFSSFLFFFFLLRIRLKRRLVFIRQLLLVTLTHALTHTRSKWVAPHFTSTVITIVLCFVRANKRGVGGIGVVRGAG